MNSATSLFTKPTLVRNAGTGFSSIFEHSPLPAACCDSKGMIVERNLAFDRTLKWTSTVSRSWTIYDLVAPEQREITDDQLRDLFEGKRDSIHIRRSRSEHASTEPATEVLTLNWIAWRLPKRNDDPVCAVVVAENNDGSFPDEQDCLQAQRWEAVGRLTGGVVHDFNNLLTGVMLYCDLLLSSLDSPEHCRRYADEIRQSIVQSAGLVHQLLVFARPQASRVRALSLNQIAREMRNLLARLIGENIILDLDLDPNLARVKIDQAQAQQVLLNLVLNARDAMPSGGRIVIGTSNCKFQSLSRPAPAIGVPAFPCVLLTVEDNGCGMDAKTRQRLFDPFFTTKSAGKGTGLGLTTVRGIVATNGGLIHVKSEPGRGTCFTILLPTASDCANTPDLPAPHFGFSQEPFQEINEEAHS